MVQRHSYTETLIAILCISTRILTISIEKFPPAARKAPFVKGSLGCARNFELLQISREKSRKTEAVFLVALKGAPGGKSKSPRARFLFVTFSFGEAKEKVKLHPLISKKSSYLDKHIVNHIKTLRIRRQLPFHGSLGPPRRTCFFVQTLSSRATLSTCAHLGKRSTASAERRV